jgi:hypothetical protein
MWLITTKRFSSAVANPGDGDNSVKFALGQSTTLATPPT